mgnify:FL=1
MTKKVGFSILLVFLLGVGAAAYIYWDLLRILYHQPQLFKEPQLDPQPKLIKDDLGEFSILSFSKTNGYRHHESIAKSKEFLDGLGRENNWSFFHTEDSGFFLPENLERFALVFLNHKSGTVWTKDQRVALRNYLENGGSIFAQHAAGGDNGYDWNWYRDELIRAQFVDHPMVNHIQLASLILEKPSHPVLSGLPQVWRRADEWYNFAESPRARTNVLIRIDESTYDPEKSPMGEDHPMVWWHQVGEGRVLYSALGHTTATYDEPEFKIFIRNSILWLVGER